MLSRAYRYLATMIWATPDAMALLGLLVVLSIFVVASAFRRAAQTRRGTIPPNGEPIPDRRARVIVLCGGVAVGMIAATALTFPNPRYVAFAVPFSFAAVWLVVARLVPKTPRLVLLIAWLALNLINQSGILYPSRFPRNGIRGEPDLLRAYIAKERSREYAREIRDVENVIRFIGREYPDAVVLTTPPYGHMLCLPFLGYVHAPVAGFCEQTDTDFTYPMCPMEGLLNEPTANASVLATRPVLLLHDFSEQNPGRLPRKFDPTTGPRFNDRIVYGDREESGGFQVWKLDPNRVRWALTGSPEAP